MEKIHKLFLTAACLAGLSLSSCVKDAETVDVAAATTKTFRATTELATRTTLDGDHNVIWSENDRIVVFGITDAQNNNGKVFALVEGAGTTEGVFSGSIDNGYAGYYALYPYSCYQSATTSGRYKIQLNPNAVFTERNFVDEANPMVAYGTENDGFKFHNLCGIVEFQITGSGSVKSIEVISGDGKPLAGMFYANTKTYELEATNSFSGTSIENYQCIYAELDTPVELSATPRSIYAVLPPATYGNLQIRTVDTDGNITVRKATKPIEVTRSHIVPVSEFSHAPVTDAPYVTIYYDEERSNFYRSIIRFDANSYTSGFYYCRLPYANYENLVAQGQSDFQILASNASDYTGTAATLNLTTSGDMGSKYVVLGLAYLTAEGGKIWDANNVSKLVFTTKQIPFDNTLTPEIEAESLYENLAMFIISGKPLSNYRVLASVFTDQEYSNYTDDEKGLAVTIGFYTNYHSDSANYSTTGFIRFDDLIPNTKYHLLYTVTDGIHWGMFTDVYTRYATIREYEFTTPAHVPSAATVTLSEPDAADYSAEFKATAGEGVTKIKYVCTSYENTYSADEVALYGNEVALASNESTIIKLSDLLAETTYYIYAVAYDANDSYGEISSLTFTTLAPIPVDDPEYAKFLGTYTLTLDSGSAPAARTVTISEDVKGKKFKVKGLINPSVVAQYNLDDTVEATFNDGEICIAPQEIADSGTIPGRFGGDVVTMHLQSETYSWYNPAVSLRSAYNDGTLTLKTTFDDIEWDGFRFMVGNRGYIEYYRGMVLTKQND